ncbi:hypothetical protein BC829DRAFT_444627 [Chytridium lagenaria]|nr:hypothetical protein BC829DRAFT_444627 [Chytridium lagenaria]
MYCPGCDEKIPELTTRRELEKHLRGEEAGQHNLTGDIIMLMTKLDTSERIEEHPGNRIAKPKFNSKEKDGISQLMSLKGQFTWTKLMEQLPSCVDDKAVAMSIKSKLSEIREQYQTAFRAAFSTAPSTHVKGYYVDERNRIHILWKDEEETSQKVLEAGSDDEGRPKYVPQIEDYFEEGMKAIRRLRPRNINELQREKDQPRLRVDTSKGKERRPSRDEQSATTSKETAASPKRVTVKEFSTTSPTSPRTLRDRAVKEPSVSVTSVTSPTSPTSPRTLRDRGEEAATKVKGKAVKKVKMAGHGDVEVIGEPEEIYSSEETSPRSRKIPEKVKVSTEKEKRGTASKGHSEPKPSSSKTLPTVPKPSSSKSVPEIPKGSHSGIRQQIPAFVSKHSLKSQLLLIAQGADLNIDSESTKEEIWAEIIKRAKSLHPEQRLSESSKIYPAMLGVGETPSQSSSPTPTLAKADRAPSNGSNGDDDFDELYEASDRSPLHPSDRRLRVTEQGASNTGIATGIETTGNPVPVVDIQTPLSQQAAPIHGTFKIKSGQISDDATIRQANPRRNAYFDNVASAQASALRNSFFRRHWEHLAQTADYMSRKINAGVLIFASYPECQAAKGYLSAGFEKNVPGEFFIRKIQPYAPAIMQY